MKALFLFLVLLSSNSLAEMKTGIFYPDVMACEEKHVVYEGTQIQQISGQNICYLSIHPLNTKDLVYRDYLFDTEGLMMVFNSYGEGPDNIKTGAREFYFFPRTKDLNYYYDSKKNTVVVTLPNNREVIFNAADATLAAIEGATIKVADEIIDSNKSGVEVVNYQGTYLDLGFKLGQSPSQNPNRKVSFKKGSSTCTVKNSAIFNYTLQNDVTFKYGDTDLDAFLTTQCGFSL